MISNFNLCPLVRNPGVIETFHAVAQNSSSVLSHSHSLSDLTIPDSSEVLFVFFPPSFFHLGSHVSPRGFQSSFSNLPAPVTPSWFLNFGLALPKVPPTSCKYPPTSLASYFPAIVWRLFFPPLYLHLLPCSSAGYSPVLHKCMYHF